MTLGEKIKMQRVRNRLTQKDLADQVHVTFQTVSKWENNENEPDIATLRELAKLFKCSIDYLASPDEEENPKAETVPVAPVVQVPVVEQKTIVVHQKEMHVCERCQKDIPDEELVMEQICVKHGHRGHAPVYRQGYYHKACLDAKHKECALNEKRAKDLHAAKARKISFGWSIPFGVVCFAIALIVFLTNSSVGALPSILFSLLIGYAMFSMLYCILTGSYIAEVFVWCAKLSIRFPGIIFSWDIGGVIFLITMKVLFAVLGFLIGVFALMFAIAFSGSLGAVSFPFVLIHNIRNDYEDAF